jgi:hypothetical protein
MKSKAIDDAIFRLDQARTAVATLETRVFNRRVLESAWWAFLLATNAVYTKLEQGSKGDGGDEAWFGQAKELRRKDELLSYIHHARNSDEHRLESVTAPKGIGGYAVEGAEVVLDSEGNITGIKATAGVPMRVQLTPPGIRLLPVTDRSRTYNPPTTHLGQTLWDNSPLWVAKSALHYLEGLVADAAARL